MRNQSTKLELQKRIRIIQDYILRDFDTPDIITECIKLWGITDRQAYRYLWAANRFFGEKSKITLQRKTEFYLARKRKLIRDMDPEEKKSAAGVAAIDRVLNSMAKLEGVSVHTVKVIGDPAHPIRTVAENTYTSNVDYSKLPTEFLEALLMNRKAS